MVHRVDAHGLDPAAAQGVEHHVQREDPAVGELEPPVEPDQQQRGADVPQRLVQEGRVERRELLVALRAVLDRDLETPRQLGRPTEQFLVEVVAEPADGLGDQQARCQGVGHLQKVDVVPPAGDPGAHGTEGDGAPDPEATLPDLDRVDRVAALAEVQLRVRDDVVQPTADDAERDGPHRDVADGARPATARDETLLGDPDRGEAARDDAQRIRPDRQRPQVPHRLFRRGDEGRDTHVSPFPRRHAALPPAHGAQRVLPPRPFGPASNVPTRTRRSPHRRTRPPRGPGRRC